MATVWTVDFTIEDRQRAPAHLIVNLPSTTSVVLVNTWLGVIAPFIEALIDGAIVSVSASLALDISGLGLRTAALDNADREEGALFSFHTSGNHYTRMRIPTFKEGKIVTGTKLVDLSDGDVSTFVTSIIAGSAGGAPCDSRGEDIDDINNAVDDFKRYSKKYVAA